MRKTRWFQRRKKLRLDPKYRSVFQWLDQEKCYSVSSITQIYVAHAPNLSILDKFRIRIALERLKNSPGFPPEGDGKICLHGQKPASAWFGSRWILAGGGNLTTTNAPDKWHALDILSCGSILFLDQIAPRLKLDHDAVVVHARRLEQAGWNLWDAMGMRKLWNRWAVYMPVFRHYYALCFYPYKQVNENWHPEELYCQDGTFLLADVCALLPPARARRFQDAADIPGSGIHTDEAMQCKVVCMAEFRNWMNAQTEAHNDVTDANRAASNNQQEDGGA